MLINAGEEGVEELHDDVLDEESGPVKACKLFNCAWWRDHLRSRALSLFIILAGLVINVLVRIGEGLPAIKLRSHLVNGNYIFQCTIKGEAKVYIKVFFLYVLPHQIYM